MIKFTFRRIAIEDNKFRDATPKEQLVLACLIDDALAALDDTHGFDLTKHTAVVEYDPRGSTTVNFSRGRDVVSLHMFVSYVNHETKQPTSKNPVWTIRM